MIQRGDERSGALFSDSLVYRYLLWRTLSDDQITQAGGVPRAGALLFCGLNPSTADETKNDPTMTREIGFTAREGYRKLIKWNVFAFRATDPGELLRPGDPIGPDNEAALDLALSELPALVVCAWGPKARYKGQDLCALWVLESDHRCGLGKLRCLKLTKGGFPSHSLYLPAATPFQPYGRSIMERHEEPDVSRGTPQAQSQR